MQALATLPDGQVLVVGGSGYNGVLLTAERYDPATNTWRPAGRLTTPYHTTATALPDGRVLAIGIGGGGPSFGPTVERYDPATDRWSPGPPLNTPRFGHTATLLPDGRLLVVGGVGFGEDGHIALPDAERYDPPSAAPAAVPPATSTVQGTGGALTRAEP